MPMVSVPLRLIVRIYIGANSDARRTNWIYHFDYISSSDIELYVASLYFIVTTIMTVGYGDITAISVSERLLCILLMLIGVIAFSFATGAISSIISSQDTAEAKLKEKMVTLETIKNEYNIESDLFNRIVKAVRYDHNQNSKTV